MDVYLQKNEKCRNSRIWVATLAVVKPMRRNLLESGRLREGFFLFEKYGKENEHHESVACKDEPGCTPAFDDGLNGC